MQNSEEWKPVPGFESLYIVSNYGRIMNSRGHIIKENIDRDGYALFHARKNNKRKCFKIHRLVMSVFIGGSKLSVNHIDGNKLNNWIDNLEYVTHSQNMQHALNLGLYKSRLNPIDVQRIRCAMRKGLKRKFILEHFNIKRSNYDAIKRGITWKNVR